MLRAMTKLVCAFVYMLALSATLSYGQDYDLKKDVILFDNVPYAKYSGKIGMLKGTNVMVSSLNGDSLIAIKQWKYPSGNPMFSYLDGYEIRFVGSGKKVIRSCEMTLTKEQLVNFIFNGRNYAGKWEDTFTQKLIVNNSVDPAAEAAFLEKFDNAKAIALGNEYEQKEREILVDLLPIQRDKTMPLQIKSIGESTSPMGIVTESYEVYQGQFLGKIIKEHKTTGSQKYTYTFKYPFNKKFNVGGVEFDEVVIATATVDSWPKIYVSVDGKSKNLDIPNPASAEWMLTEYLINNGKL